MGNAIMENQYSTRPKQEFNSDRYVESGHYPSSFYAGLKQRTQLNGGTSTFFHGEPETGYIVGFGKYGRIMSAKEFYSVVNIESELNSDIGRWKVNGFDGFGTWVDSGIVYIDPIDTYTFLEQAIQVAQKREERAIYDIENNRTIFVDPA